MTVKQFTKLALALEGTEQHPHFDRIAFKVPKNRIFATLHEPSQSVNLMLSVVDQSVFCQYDKSMIYPVPNKWGLKGVTTFELKKVPQALLKDALETAYRDSLKKKR
ncbi:MAG: MmcQ/YjbR family DNA-binding protein [Cyclobacteriaceae bacterium]